MMNMHSFLGQWTAPVRWTARTLSVLLVFGLVACDSGGGDAVGPPTRVEIGFADTAAFVVDTTVTASATVSDASGRPVSNATVQWSTQNGTVSPRTGTTGPNGTVETSWTLGTDATGANAQSLQASVESTPDVSATRAVDVNPGPVQQIEATAEASVLPIDSMTTVSITRLTDAFGNEIRSAEPYSFTWTSLTPDSATVVAGTPSTTAQVQGVGDGYAQIVVSTGGAPSASLENIQKTGGAAVDTVGIDVRQHELRGVWLTNVDSNVLNSRGNIEEAMQFLADHNFNVVFPVVWNQAATLYPSTVMDTLINRPIDPAYAGRDPLQEIIEAAHERDIAVIPWFEYGFASSFSTGGGPILDKYPQWAAKDQNGDLLEKNGFEWMNPYHPGVQDLLMALIMEVVNNYDVDGIQGDDRLPAHPVEGGYSSFTKDRYRQDHDGQNPPSNLRDPEWMEWRADILNAFGQNVYDNVKAVNEDLIVSWSPSVWSFSYREYLQEWPAWVNRGFTDLIHPQVYRRNVGAYQATLDAQGPNRAGWNADQIIGFYPGVLLKVGGYVATPEDIKAFVQANRDRGYQGEVFFFYEGLREFDADVADALKKSFYRDPAPLPFPRASRQ